MRRNVVINWGVSSFFGWGIYGLNLALAWANDPQVALVAGLPIGPQDLALDPVRMRALAPFLQESARLQAQLAGFKGGQATTQGPMLAGLDQNFRIRLTREVALSGRPTLGVTFFETATLSQDAVAAASRYPLIITGSTWNEQVLRAHGLTNVRTILQGVDPTLFHPAPRTSYAGDRFLVFSGGKLEHRKGQDIALAAFRRFAERHPDALLVAAWHSPWPQFARTVDRTGLAAPVVFGTDGRLDAAAWAAANGVGPENFLDAGQTPNPLMPQLYRQMDVGLFPNRCEGGTNLVAMECMACGVPVILSANSGHLDLIEDDNCFVLTRQGEVTGDPHAAAFGDTPGWGESDVDEAVELLERAYADRAETRRRGERGAETMRRLTWSATAAQVKAAVLEVSASEPARTDP
ncbi:MAG: mshA 8 [Phenylobacterium sp.]|nr:mshA 8 [Phenylobacterium sp.]